MMSNKKDMQKQQSQKQNLVEKLVEEKEENHVKKDAVLEKDVANFLK
jgi:hypothetical protein